MRGYSIMSDEERQSILQQHSSFYNGYAVGNVPSNLTPLTVYDPAGDKGGITVDNKGDVSTYKNHLVNESTISDESVMSEIEADDMDVSYVEPADDFKSGGPEQFADSDPDKDPYDMDLEAIMRMFDYGDDEKEAYDFESEGGNMDVYGESVVSEESKMSEKQMAWKEFQEKHNVTDKTIKVARKDFEKMWNETNSDVNEEEETESMCEQCGLSESICECGMYEEIDDELHESFKTQKEKITEMFNRFKNYN